MKTINYLIYALLCVTMVSACNSEDVTREDDVTRVPLEISIGNNETRSIIEETTIPYQTSFGIFGIPNSYSFDGTIAQDINNVSVFYDGKCTLSKDVLLNSTPIYLKAYYPYNKDLRGRYITINSSDQIDYLFGVSELANHPYYVDNKSPKADIAFRHVLSRLTLRIRHTEKYGDDFNLKNLSMLPSCETQFDVYTGNLCESKWRNEWVDFPVNVTISKDFKTIDFLVIPGERAVDIRLSQGNYYDTCIIPNVRWEAGLQYTYEITFDDNGIKVSEAVITPWESITQSGIDITDNNLVMN